MQVLCAECPTLLDVLLDGLLWTAKSASTTEAGSIRVNYYVSTATLRGRTPFCHGRTLSPRQNAWDTSVQLMPVIDAHPSTYPSIQLSILPSMF